MKLVLASIKRYLKEPYPYYYNNHRRLLLFLFLISFLSFSFSYFFEPFEVNVIEHRIPSIWILMIHAFIPFPIFYVYFTIIVKKPNRIQWTLGKELSNLSILFLIIGVVDFLIRDIIYTNPNNWSFRYLWEEIRNTFLVGTLLLFIILPLNLERLIQKHKTLLKQLSNNSLQNDDLTKSIVIKSSISDDDFELIIKDFLYAKVESNYTEIYMYSSGQLSKKLIRITLKDLENQLQVFSSVFRTHRSYLVNLNKIASISGNAQGYELVLKNSLSKIPVSRSYIKRFNAVHFIL